MATLNAALTPGESSRNSVDMPPGSYTVAPADLEASDAGLCQTTMTAPASPPTSIERDNEYNSTVPHPLFRFLDELLLNIASHLPDQDLCNLKSRVKALRRRRTGSTLQVPRHSQSIQLCAGKVCTANQDPTCPVGPCAQGCLAEVERQIHSSLHPRKHVAEAERNYRYRNSAVAERIHI
jgi:hypothetical protein